MCNCGCVALGGFASSHAIQASSVGSVGAFSSLVVGAAFRFTTATLRVRCHLSFPEDGTTVYARLAYLVGFFHHLMVWRWVTE